MRELLLTACVAYPKISGAGRQLQKGEKNKPAGSRAFICKPFGQSVSRSLLAVQRRCCAIKIAHDHEGGRIGRNGLAVARMFAKVYTDLISHKREMCSKHSAKLLPAFRLSSVWGPLLIDTSHTEIISKSEAR